MKLATTGDIIKMLQEQDPTGEKPVVFHIFDERDDRLIASGDTDKFHVDQKFSSQTQDGDHDVVRLHVWLDVSD